MSSAQAPQAQVRYWDREAWANYMANDVLPLYETGRTLSLLWDAIHDLTDGRLLSEALRVRSSLEYVFFGGLRADAESLPENSLARAYQDLFGTSADVGEYILLKRYGKELKIRCSVKETEFVRYAKHIAELLGRSLRAACGGGLIGCQLVDGAEARSRQRAEEVLSSPEMMPDAVVQFLNAALRFVIPYNPYTLTLRRLRKIPKKYMKLFFPELLSRPEALELFTKVMGLRVFAVPAVDDHELKDEYTIYSFDYAVSYDFVKDIIDGTKIGPNLYGYFIGTVPEVMEPYNTIGGAIVRANELVWGLFSELQMSLPVVVSDGLPSPWARWLDLIVNEGCRGQCPSNRIDVGTLGNYGDLKRIDDWALDIVEGTVELVYEMSCGCYRLYQRAPYCCHTKG